GECKFNVPMGITIDEKTGYIYVCDYGNNRLQVFYNNLKFKEPMLTSILRGPLDIELYRNWIIILDEREYCCHIYNKENGVSVNDIVSRLDTLT
ncbi:hypothetical protein, partial [Salmonella sp. s51228]|uniref:hypothetical protein n=1 Tax=Salmonella sp. s51228 TaxID=3159652 RepID=UPI0039810C24